MLRVRARGAAWFVPRVLRGGSWNNNPQNVRAANRDNNIGFRVCGVVHMVICFVRCCFSYQAPSEMPADYGLPAEAGA